MTKAELETYRQKLLAMGNRVQTDVSHLADEAMRSTGGAASGNLSNLPIHLADLGTDNYEQEVAMNLLENEAWRQGEIAAALDRIDQGTFGRCEGCGKDVPRARLAVIPFTRYCVQCAEKFQASPPRDAGL